MTSRLGNELLCAETQNSHRHHGTYAKYVIEKCRCEPCRDANRDYERDRKRRQAMEAWHPERARWVDAEPIRKHVRSLMASGVGQTDGVGLKRIVKVAGVSQTMLWKLMYGKTRPDGSRTPSKRIHRDAAARLLGVTRDDMADGARLDELQTRRLWHMVDELVAWFNAEVGVESGNGMGRHPYGGKTWLGRILTGNPKAAALQLSRRSISVRHGRMIRDLHDQTVSESESFRWRFCKCDVDPDVDLPRKVDLAPLRPFLDGADLGELERMTGVARRTLQRLKAEPEGAQITLGLFDRIAVGLGRPELAS